MSTFIDVTFRPTLCRIFTSRISNPSTRTRQGSIQIFIARTAMGPLRDQRRRTEFPQLQLFCSTCISPFLLFTYILGGTRARCFCGRSISHPRSYIAPLQKQYSLHIFVRYLQYLYTLTFIILVNIVRCAVCIVVSSSYDFWWILLLFFSPKFISFFSYKGLRCMHAAVCRLSMLMYMFLLLSF